MLGIGMIIDRRYKILREIGRGGTSCVYLAENIRLHNYWAIKEVYKSGVTWDGEKQNSLITESSVLTKLRHPGLPAIIDVMDTPDSYLIVMEYIEGVSLDKIIEQNGAQTEQNVRKWAIQLCDVLDYLHNNMKSPIIYCDMKPANIMVKPDGNVVLIDFGMVKHKLNRQTNESYGTFGYAAPEQFDESMTVDERTDIYSLGISMYSMLTGLNPCNQPYQIKPVRSIKPYLTANIENIIFNCTKFNKENRYQSAKQLKAELLGLIDNYKNPLVFDEVEQGKKKPYWIIGLCIGIAVCIGIVATVFVVLDNTDAMLDENYTKLQSYNYVDIDYKGEYEYFEFQPEVSGYYTIYSYAHDGCVPVCWLSDSDGKILKSDNTRAEYDDFQITYWFDSSEKYYVDVALYDLTDDFLHTGTFEVMVIYEGLGD